MRQRLYPRVNGLCAKLVKECNFRISLVVLRIWRSEVRISSGRRTSIHASSTPNSSTGHARRRLDPCAHSQPFSARENHEGACRLGQSQSRQIQLRLGRVDGPNALPLRLDGDIPNLGRFAACRRVARTIYLGSAPTATAAHRGIEERQVKLGCIMPGETAPVFGDALRRLSAAATYLYHDGTRYWYSTQPTVTKLAEDRAEQLTRNPDNDKRVRADVRNAGDFPRVHALPPSGHDVPDDMDARLVVLGVDHPYSKDPANPAEAEAKAIVEKRGNAPRLFANTLVFLALDKVRLQDLDEAIRRYLAWKSILDAREELNLDPQQVRQDETQLASADGAVTARLPEAYQWLLVPVQTSPQAPVQWQAVRLSGQDALAVRASKKLRNDELLVTAFAGTSLRGELDRIPLWRGNHVAIKQLAEDFARYIYLPRLADPAVLSSAIQDGLGLLTWEKESFAYADDFDEKAGRYRGLRHGKIDSLSPGALIGLLVRPEIAKTVSVDPPGAYGTTMRTGWAGQP
jgi:hypothetical protein